MSKRQQYVQSLEKAQEDITKAVAGAIPTGEAGYDAVRVLAHSWDNDDLGIQSAEKRLLDVFEQGYLFSTERFIIPTKPPGPKDADSASAFALMHLSTKLTEFLYENCTANKLAIIVYNGHAGGTGHELFLSGRRNGKINIAWNAIRTRLEENKRGDILLILDGCYSTAAAFEHPRLELLAAASREGMAPGDTETSLTVALAKRLDYYCDSISAGQDEG